MTTLLRLLIGIHLAACNTILYDDCIVQDEVMFYTFKNSVTFFMSAYGNNDMKVTIEAGNDKSEILYRFQDLQWIEATLTLSGSPTLEARNRFLAYDNNTAFAEGIRKRVKIETAYVLLGCPQGLPNWEMMNDISYRIPSPGGEYTLIMLPKENTKVTMDVYGKVVVLCLNGKSMQLVDKAQERSCSLLPKDKENEFTVTPTETNQVEILGRTFPLEGGAELKILKDGLRGTLYIIQCLNSCSHKGTEASVTGGTFMNNIEAPATEEVLVKGVKERWLLWVMCGAVAFLAILVMLLVVKVCHIRSQLHRLETTTISEEASVVSGGSRSNPMVLQEQRSKSGVVDTPNDIYVPFEELWQK